MKYAIRTIDNMPVLHRYEEPSTRPIPTNAEFEFWCEIERLREENAKQQELLNFFYGQMQMHSPNISGQHPWRFRSGGWPMNHCVGASRQEAAMNAVLEIRKEQPQS